MKSDKEKILEIFREGIRSSEGVLLDPGQKRKTLDENHGYIAAMEYAIETIETWLD